MIDPVAPPVDAAETSQQILRPQGDVFEACGQPAYPPKADSCAGVSVAMAMSRMVSARRRGCLRRSRAARSSRVKLLNKPGEALARDRHGLALTAGRGAREGLGLRLRSELGGAVGPCIIGCGGDPFYVIATVSSS